MNFICAKYEIDGKEYGFYDLMRHEYRNEFVDERIFKERIREGKTAYQAISVEPEYVNIKHHIGGEDMSIKDVLAHPIRNKDITDARIIGRIKRGCRDTRLMTCVDLVIDGKLIEEPEEEMYKNVSDILPFEKDTRSPEEIQKIKDIMSIPQSEASSYVTYLPKYQKRMYSTMIEENKLEFSNEG